MKNNILLHVFYTILFMSLMFSLMIACSKDADSGIVPLVKTYYEFGIDGGTDTIRTTDNQHLNLFLIAIHDYKTNEIICDTRMTSLPTSIEENGKKYGTITYKEGYVYSIVTNWCSIIRCADTKGKLQNKYLIKAKPNVSRDYYIGLSFHGKNSEGHLIIK